MCMFLRVYLHLCMHLSMCLHVCVRICECECLSVCLGVSLQHRLEQAASGIGLHVNADKTDYICFNQKEDIFTQTRGSLKLVDKFTYLRSSISSMENDINVRLTKAWTAIDRLSIIWKSDLSDKIKHSFSKQQPYPYYNMDAPHGR